MDKLTRVIPAEVHHVCPTCHTTVSAEKARELRRSWKPFWIGMICGIIGCVGMVGSLWAYIELSDITVSVVVMLP